MSVQQMREAVPMNAWILRVAITVNVLKDLLFINECLTDRGGCSHSCINTEGSYECICPAGYRLNRPSNSCVDLNECRYEDPCEHRCINTPGSHYCQCEEGYALYADIHCAGKFPALSTALKKGIFVKKMTISKFYIQCATASCWSI